MSAVAIDPRVRVATGLREAAGRALRADARLATVEWLAGWHPEWWGYYGDLSSDIRDRMRRAASDLAFEMPGADRDAAELLAEAARWLDVLMGGADEVEVDGVVYLMDHSPRRTELDLEDPSPPPFVVVLGRSVR